MGKPELYLKLFKYRHKYEKSHVFCEISFNNCL